MEAVTLAVGLAVVAIVVIVVVVGGEGDLGLLLAPFDLCHPCLDTINKTI